MFRVSSSLSNESLRKTSWLCPCTPAFRPRTPQSEPSPFWSVLLAGSCPLLRVGVSCLERSVFGLTRAVVWSFDGFSVVRNEKRKTLHRYFVAAWRNCLIHSAVFFGVCFAFLHVSGWGHDKQIVPHLPPHPPAHTHTDTHMHTHTKIRFQDLLDYRIEKYPKTIATITTHDRFTALMN